MNAYIRTAIRTVVLPLSVLGLAACAGMHEKSDSAYVASQRAPSTMDEDALYVARVEQIARRRGIEVVWVHIPRKRATKTD